MKLLTLALATILAVAFPYSDPLKPHRTADGFRNNYPHAEKQGFWRWKWDQLRDGLPPNPEGGYRFETANPELAANPSVTWVGHATVLLRVGGLSVHDHLDQDSVGRLAEQAGGSPRFFVPLGLKDWFARRGIHDVVELDWWERRDFKGLDVHFVPVQHWSARTLTDENQTLWGGWVIRHPELSFFFAGDAGYSRDFTDIGAKFGGFDLAAIPIGAYAPRWFMQIMHMDPAEAVRVHKDVKARRSVAIHWGTFANLTDESLYEPPLRLAGAKKEAGLSDDDFFVLKHGETRVLR